MSSLYVMYMANRWLDSPGHNIMYCLEYVCYKYMNKVFIAYLGCNYSISQAYTLHG